MRVSLWLVLLMASIACTKTAMRADGTPSDQPCPRLGEERQHLETFGRLTVRQACQAGLTCSDGPYACRCEAPQGGPPRPPWWECHRARDKKDGCPDDDQLRAGVACAPEGKACEALGGCGCSSTTLLQCVKGAWVRPPCDVPCLAP